MGEADFAARDVYLDAAAVFGGVEVFVPDGVEVRVTGLAVFGGKSCRVTPAQPGAPVLHVRCRVVFGGVDIKNRRSLAERVSGVRDVLRPPKPPQLPGPPPP